MISPYSVRKVTGVGTSIIDLCRDLGKNNVEFKLVVPVVDEHFDLEPIFKMGSNYFEAAGPDVNFGKNLGIIRYNLKLLKKNRRNIDVVHLFSIKSITAAGALYAKILNKPVVTTIYIIPPGSKSKLKRIVNNIAISLILRLTDKFAYETYVARNQCGNRPGIIIPEGIDVEHFKPDKAVRTRIRNDLGIEGGKLVLLYSGRLIESKGIKELIAAAESLPESILKKFKLLLIGNIESDTIKRELDRVWNQPWFMHHDPVKRDEIKDYYCAADAFVLPSYYEGISSSLIEAMACELPPIVTNVGGNVEVVRHGKNGLVVEPRNVNELSSSIARLLSDRKMIAEMGKKARADVIEGFSLKKKSSSYIKLYEKVVTENKIL